MNNRKGNLSPYDSTLIKLLEQIDHKVNELEVQAHRLRVLSMCISRYLHNGYITNVNQIEDVITAAEKFPKKSIHVIMREVIGR